MAEIRKSDLTNQDAHTEIARLSPEAAGFVAAALEAGERERDWINRTVIESLERQRDDWRARALKAEALLNQAANRVLGLIYGPEETDGTE